MTRTARCQRGATLLISLIMLVVLTLFALAGFNLSSVNLKVAGNFQQQRFMEATVAQALEQVISDPTSFVTPSAQTIAVNGVNVATTAAVCYHSTVAEGYEINVGADGKTVGPEDNVWEVRGSGTDALTGAQATVTQGLRIRMLPGNCP